MLDARCQMPDARCQMPVLGQWPAVKLIIVGLILHQTYLDLGCGPQKVVLSWGCRWQTGTSQVPCCLDVQPKPFQGRMQRSVKHEDGKRERGDGN